MSNPKMEIVNLHDLTVDINCQQPLRPGKVKKMVETGFRKNLAGSLIVSRRDDGEMVILDGQHRREAGIQSGVKYLPALVFTGLTPEKESEMFLGHNTKTNPTPVSKFRVGVNAGRSVELEINFTLERHGWRVIEGSTKRGGFKPVGAAYDIYLRRGAFNHPDKPVDGGVLFQYTIQVITDAFGNDTKAAHVSIVRGVAYFIQRYWSTPEMDTARLTDRLRGVKPEVLVSQIKANKDALGVKQEAAGAYTIANIYNERLRSGRLDKTILLAG